MLNNFATNIKSLNDIYINNEPGCFKALFSYKWV